MKLFRRIALLLSLIPLSQFAWSVGNTGGFRVSGQNSAFLEMHAGNPVNWYPWGQAAFHKAKSENKLIFISVGYSGCLWCHRMAEKTFSDPAVADYLNKHFVSILVDKEQRPDIAGAFNRFVVTAGLPGGYPINIFATPDGVPFIANFYMPPRSNAVKIGLLDESKLVQENWQKNGARYRKIGMSIVNQIKTKLAKTDFTNAYSLSPVTAQTATEQLLSHFDRQYGGFGQRQKLYYFPRLKFLLNSKNPQAKKLGYLTLNRIIASATNDQLGGGFFDFSYSRDWGTPGFEKNIYTQLSMIDVLLDAYGQTGNILYKHEVIKTFDFIKRKLMSDEGYLFTKISGSSPINHNGPTAPGAYYLWDWYDVLNILPDANVFDATTYYYGFSPDGNNNEGNNGSIDGMNLPYIAKSFTEVAKIMKTTPQRVEQLVAFGSRKMQMSRALRTSPRTDTTTKTAWNGYAIQTYLKAADILSDTSYIVQAQKIEKFVHANLFRPEDRMLYASYRRGTAGQNGGLLDYLFFADGEYDLYSATHDESYLQRATKTVDIAINYYWDEHSDVFYDTAANDPLFVRFKSYKDGAFPNGNSLAAELLLKLGVKTRNRNFILKSNKIVKWQLAHAKGDYTQIPYTFLNWNSYLSADRLLSVD